MPSRSRNWCFTLNNPRAELNVDVAQHDAVSYICYQLELAASGTPHYQGYIVFTSPRGLGYCQQLIPGAHFEPRRARTHAAAIAYCKKPETRLEGPFEYGTVPTDNQGSRSDLLAFKQALDSGATDKQLWDEHPACFIRYYPRCETIRSLLKTPRRNKSYVILAIGRPGSGKSRHAETLAGTRGISQEELYWKPPNSHWWPGYRGQKMIVLDDFKSWFPWTELMQLLDRYPFKVQTKGGYTEFTSEVIYITTNFHPDDWYDSKFPMEALFRRIDETLFFEDPTIINSDDPNNNNTIFTPNFSNIEIRNFNKVMLE